jgi:hypothetical protein
MRVCSRGWTRDLEAGLSYNLSVLATHLDCRKAFQVNRPSPTSGGRFFVCYRYLSFRCALVCGVWCRLIGRSPAASTIPIRATLLPTEHYAAARVMSAEAGVKFLPEFLAFGSPMQSAFQRVNIHAHALERRLSYQPKLSHHRGLSSIFGFIPRIGWLRPGGDLGGSDLRSQVARTEELANEVGLCSAI